MLENLLAPIQKIPGVGPKKSILFKKISCENLMDVLLKFPISKTSFHIIHDIQKANHNELIFIKVTIKKILPPRGGVQTIFVNDGENNFQILLLSKKEKFNSIIDRKEFYIAGKVSFYRLKKEIKIYYPLIIPLSEININNEPKFHSNQYYINVRYSLPKGISQNFFRRILKSVINDNILPLNNEWLPEFFLKNYHWPSWKQAILEIHYGKDPKELSFRSLTRQRLAFDELLAYQIRAQRITNELARKEKLNTKKLKIYKIHLYLKIRKSIPFILTKCQRRVLSDILKRMRRSQQITHLIQGEVGSGKTIIATLLSSIIIGSGYQVVLLAPTEILVNQHLEFISNIFKNTLINVKKLSKSDQINIRRNTINQLKDGKINLIIGTHALLEENVIFNNTGMIIIDEQHRFGVDQRIAISKKGNNSHILLMTATPIPRTLQAILYNTLTVSNLYRKPEGRLSPITKVVHNSKFDEVIKFLKRIIYNSYEKVYWVCPTIEFSKRNVISITERSKDLEHHFHKEIIKSIHGKMSEKQKKETLNSFRNSDQSMILVSSSIIEVGIDVPRVNYLIIEDANYFGLSQLHQIRGRIGRSESKKEPICILIYRTPISKISENRLKILKETNDAFILSEKDLYLRGPGEYFGLYQSGIPNFKLIDFNLDPKLFIKLSKLSFKYASYVTKKEIFSIDQKNKNDFVSEFFQLKSFNRFNKINFPSII